MSSALDSTKFNLISPVLLLGFNRADLCERVIDSLREVNAQVIYFSVDGPRIGRKDDEFSVLEVQRLVSKFDWGCKVITRFLPSNMGCMMAISSAITWFFESEKEGIILEDDCLPSNDFYFFTQKMLERYRSNPSVMHISSGPYFAKSIDSFEFNHFFSTMQVVSGWGTWKTSWDHYDLEMKLPELQIEKQMFSEFFSSRKISNWFTRYVREARSPKSTVWSTQWSYAIIKKNGLSVVPVVNLLNHIGSDERATHGTSHELYDNYPIERIPNLPDPENIDFSWELIAQQYKFLLKTDLNQRLTHRIKTGLLNLIIKLLPFPLRRILKKLNLLKFMN